LTAPVLGTVLAAPSEPVPPLAPLRICFSEDGEGAQVAASNGF
jgi:hypothetical protein